MNILWAILTFLAGPVLFFSFLRIISDQKQAIIALLISLGVGPFLVVRSLNFLLQVVPGRSPFFYLVILTLFFVVGIFLINRFLKEKENLLPKFSDCRWLPWTLVEKLLFLILVICLVVLLVIIWISPVTGNDTLEYLQVARLFFESMSIADYPFLNAEISGGLYTPWYHPPGFSGLLLLGYLTQGHAENPGVASLWNFYYILLTLALMCMAAKQFFIARTVTLFVGCILFLVTPMYWSQALDLHIDSVRVFFILVILVSLATFDFQLRKRSALMFSVLISMAIYCHGLGVFAGFFFFIFVLRNRCKFFNRNGLKWISIFSGVSFLLLADHIWVMSQVRQIEQYRPIVTTSSLTLDQHFEVYRGILSYQEKILNGFLKGFSSPSELGFLYWTIGICGLFCTLIIGKRRRFSQKNDFLYLNILFVSGFYMAVFVTLLFGSVVLIKNARYFLTIHPFIFFLAVFFMDAALNSVEESSEKTC